MSMGERTIRWLAAKNVGSHTIPPYGLAMLAHPTDPAGDPQYLNQTAVDGQAVWLIQRPNELAEQQQDPAQLVANGSTPIPPGSTGSVSQDWPLPVLHNCEEDDLPNGAICGPRADSFLAWSGGGALTCQSHDLTLAQNIGNSLYHLVWVSRGRDREPMYGKLDGALASGDSVTMSIWYWTGSAWADSGDNLTVYAPPLLSSGSIASGKWVRTKWCGGIYGSGRWEVVSAEC